MHMLAQGVQCSLFLHFACIQIVLAAVDKPRNITYKGATDLVTETDKASEEAVLAVLRQAFPEHAILGEEGGVSGNTSSSYLWCVGEWCASAHAMCGWMMCKCTCGVRLSGQCLAYAYDDVCGSLCVRLVCGNCVCVRRVRRGRGEGGGGG